MATTTDPSKYKFNRTMLRIKYAKETVKFYEFLGLSLISHLPLGTSDIYHLAYNAPNAFSHNRSLTNREGVLELHHVRGQESDPAVLINNGNREPHRGFGHVCVSVDNLQAACARLEDAGYPFQKKLTDGRMREIAFALDPNGYWVEIIGQRGAKETEGIAETDPSTYRMNHTMIRVKDAQKSLAWYQDVMGMKLMYTREQKEAGFNLYFLCYTQGKGLDGGMRMTERARHEGFLELTWNYGTEKDEAFRYHNGNDAPEGFGHIGIAVDDVRAACARLEGLDLEWVHRFKEGERDNSATVLDPDGYSVKILENTV